MKLNFIVVLAFVLASLLPSSAVVAEQSITPFVMQLTRSGENYGHRRALMQIDKILNDIGENKVKIEVVAYEDGINALLANNKETSQLVTKLSNRGIIFKACRISMRAWNLKEDDFPLEVEFVPAGAPEVIKRQIKGYKYWHP